MHTGDFVSDINIIKMFSGHSYTLKSFLIIQVCGLVQ
jgi:hypothetical protein